MNHLLLINGWSANKNFWSNFSQDLSETFEVEILDIDEIKPLDEWLAQIDQKISNNTLLMGWSLGGNLAIKYASQSDKSFLGLITLQTNPCFIAQNQWLNGLAEIEFQTLYDMVGEGDKQSLVRRFSHLLVNGSSQHKSDRKELKLYYKESSLEEKETLLSGLNLLRHLDVRAVLADVHVPCVHLLGKQDALIPVAVKRDIEAILLRRNINGKAHHVDVIPCMGHLPCWAYRADILIRIKEFMKSL